MSSGSSKCKIENLQDENWDELQLEMKTQSELLGHVAVGNKKQVV